MAVELRLPQVAEGMTAARISLWLKREGDAVEAGEAVAEVETDKTSVEIEAPAAGFLGPILVAAGSHEVPVGAVLATIEEAPPRAGPTSVAASAPEVRREPAAAREPEVRPKPAATPPSGDESVPATPLARRMAAVAGVDLSTVVFEGDRVTRADVERALGRWEASPGRALPLTPARRITAERLQQAKQTIPHFYLEIECDAGALLARRTELNSRPGAPPLTLTAFAAHAAALALVDVPAANVAWLGASEGVRQFQAVDLAIAVNTPAGLLTPVVRGAETLTLDALAARLHDLTARARAGRLAPAEYTGGTFTISNLGMYGVRSLYPIVNPPQAAILGVGAVLRRAVVRDGRVEPGHVLTCTLAADHRAMDGATGAEFLAAFKRRIEQADTLQP